jgi:hypothetical protein
MLNFDRCIQSHQKVLERNEQYSFLSGITVYLKKQLFKE